MQPASPTWSLVRRHEPDESRILDALLLLLDSLGNDNNVTAGTNGKADLSGQAGGRLCEDTEGADEHLQQ